MKAQTGTLINVLAYSLLSTISLLLTNPVMAQQSKTNGSSKATRGPASSFSGTVWVTTLVGPNPETDCLVSSVAFDPAARTFWHQHPNGQLLVVTQGTGYYQEKGKPARIIREGESVTIAPNVVHWHGAGPNGQFVHTAINPNVSKGGAVTWLEAVTAEEYPASH